MLIPLLHILLHPCPKAIGTMVFFFFYCMSPAQDLNHHYMLFTTGDTVFYMVDHLPTFVTIKGFKQDSAGIDLNGVKAPFIKKSIKYRVDEVVESYAQANVAIDISEKEREYLYIRGDTILSFGIQGTDLFNTSHAFDGLYFPPRKYSKNSDRTHGLSSQYWKLIYPCFLKDIPKLIQDQFPYQPDSIRVVKQIQESTENVINNVQVDLNLQRYRTNQINKVILQTTRIETRKSTLAWQDVTRFVKFPYLFKTDTIRQIIFLNQRDDAHLATLYFKNANDLQKIIYKAPETFKDLPIVEDFKPNLFFFPNPYTIGLLRTEMLVAHAGLYTLRIVNLVGKEMWRKNLYLESDITLDIDFSFLAKGTYFLSLEQDKDHVISTKRIFVIK